MRKNKWQKYRADGAPMTEEYRLESIRLLEIMLGRKASAHDLATHRLQPDHLVPR